MNRKLLISLLAIFLGTLLIVSILPRSVVVTAQEDDKARTIPSGNSEELYFMPYTKFDEQLLALESGEINILGWYVPPEKASQPPPENVRYVITPDLRFYYVAFNFWSEPLGDVNFRKAFSHVVDKEKIVNDFLLGFGTPMRHVLPEIFGEWVNTSARLPEYAPANASSLLDAGGYTDTNGDGWREYTDDGVQGNGTNIVLELLAPDLTFDPIMANAAILIDAAARDVGIKINVELTDYNTLYTRVFIQRDFDMYMLYWSFGYSPDLIFDLFYSSHWANIMGYTSSEFDAITDDFYSVHTTKERIELLQAAQAILAEDLPYVWLYTRDRVDAYREDQIEDIIPVVGGIVNWWTWYYAHALDVSIRVGMNDEAMSKNPYVFETEWDDYAWNPPKEKLVVVDPDTYINDSQLEYIPWLVKDYRIVNIDADHDGVNDEQNITLWVRDGVTWQDGEKFDAHDINFTIYYSQKYYGINEPGYYFSAIDTVDNPPVISGDGMVISFINLYIEPFAEINILGSYIFPEHVFNDVNLSEINNVNINIHPEYNLGTGPWKFIEHKEGEYWKYVAYKNYWNKQAPNNEDNQNTSEEENEEETPSLTIGFDYTHVSSLIGFMILLQVITRRKNKNP